MREARLFKDQILAVEMLPLAERKANAVEWYNDLLNDHMMVAQRVGWLLNGSYGKGSFDSACRVVNSPRMNQVAWCAITIANLEWRCPAKMAIMAWKKLPVEKRYLVNEAIRREIADAKAEGYCGEIKKNPSKKYLSWNTFAGGTEAFNPNHNSYSARPEYGGTYYIDPPTYRRRQWMLRFSNERTPYLGYGLWHDIERGGTANSLKKKAEEHYMRSVLPMVGK
jgi:hypothetical protein